MTSPVAYWHVADIEAKLAEVTAAGAACLIHDNAWCTTLTAPPDRRGTR